MAELSEHEQKQENVHGKKSLTYMDLQSAMYGCLQR